MFGANVLGFRILGLGLELGFRVRVRVRVGIRVRQLHFLKRV